MKTSTIMIVAILSVTTLMVGCANTGNQPVSSSSAYSSSMYGVIDAIEVTGGEVDGIAGTGVGAGAVIGGVVGGVLGHQVGGGSGQDIATAAGVVGGAVVGHQIEKSTKQQQAYRIQVRLENGNYQTVTQDSIGDFRVGDRVRIENGRLYRY